MKIIGFPVSKKENEKRRALLPEHVMKIRRSENLYFEEGYGNVLGHSDDEYRLAGANIVSREEALRSNIICDPKIGDAEYLFQLREGQTIFGWVHAVQNKIVTDELINRKVTAIAWEDMEHNGRHVFWRNNELAGEAAVLHAFTLFGKMPYECTVAVIGRGNTARGAYKTLSSLGANVSVFDRRTESLLRDEIEKFDVIVNGVLWDLSRKDHIIYKENLKRMKKPSMIIDISCDRAGAIETSIPTSIENPVYMTEDVLHYVVDHTPALVSYSSTTAIGNELVNYLDSLINATEDENSVLKAATIIRSGVIIDNRINTFQGR